MDGPYSFTVDATAVYPWTLRTIDRHGDTPTALGEIWLADDQIMTALLDAAESVLRHCSGPEWGDDEVDKLRQSVVATRAAMGLDSAGTESAATTWWLDPSGLPDLLWARLRVFQSGRAEVLDLDGCTHRFFCAEAARLWLSEDEYQTLEGLQDGGEVAAEVQPPAEWPPGLPRVPG